MADKIYEMSDTFVAFHCPGREDAHVVSISGDGAVWEWNRRLDLPTFLPSILVRSGHYAQAPGTTECWCTYAAAHPEKPPAFKCGICHSFVTAGKIGFLPDSTHKLAGQTVDLPDWES